MIFFCIFVYFLLPNCFKNLQLTHSFASEIFPMRTVNVAVHDDDDDDDDDNHFIYLRL